MSMLISVRVRLRIPKTAKSTGVCPALVLTTAPVRFPLVELCVIVPSEVADRMMANAQNIPCAEQKGRSSQSTWSRKDGQNEQSSQILTSLFQQNL